MEIRNRMATYELDEEQRIRNRHALLKDEADLKRLKKSNVEEGLDVTDIERKLHTLRGEADGRPGLIQIFSSQTELFDESKAKRKVDDPAQMRIEDEIAISRNAAGEAVWADWVPEPRPQVGERVAGLDGIETLVITDVLGYERPDMNQNGPEDGGIASDGLFVVFAVATALAQGYSVEDKRKVHVVKTGAGVGREEEWMQVTSPPVDVAAIREAARAGEIVDDQSTGTTVDGSDLLDGKPRKARGRPRAAAGNLAGAVKKTVAKATGDRKVPVGKGGKKK